VTASCASSKRDFAHPRIADKPLSVHSRRAEADCLDRLAHVGAAAILHWYSGPVGQIDRAVAAGLYFSVNPAMLKSKNGQRIVDRIPRERVLTETDGPHTKVGQRIAEPRDIPWLARRPRWCCGSSDSSQGQLPCLDMRSAALLSPQSSSRIRNRLVGLARALKLGNSPFWVRSSRRRPRSTAPSSRRGLRHVLRRRPAAAGLAPHVGVGPRRAARTIPWPPFV
jgi:TatD related DNase